MEDDHARALSATWKVVAMAQQAHGETIETVRRTMDRIEQCRVAIEAADARIGAVPGGAVDR